MLFSVLSSPRLTHKSHARPTSRAKPGFTLVEILVVVGIIALLVAILLPTLAKAREASQRVACAAQLRDIGNMVNLYLIDNKQRVMRVHPMPSNPDLLPYTAPGIVAVLQPYHKGATNVFHCASDKLIHPGSSPIAAETYFAREGTSYEYNVFFNAYAVDDRTGTNRTWVDALAAAKERPPLKLKPYELPLLVDFEAFHGKQGKPGSRNSLFADFHVAPLELAVPGNN